ncbi:hypothetical protein WN944_001530 [Citrus x changshan-huyou]|uniref:Uncharacterized protein n=1 Tax=Citrus x changshan-huyou TaxID=2935761 RepID=A0AAP0ML31_9ROSI
MQQVQHIHSGIVDELKSIEAKAGNFPASSSFKNRDTVSLDNRMEELLDLLIEGPPQLSVVAVLDSIGLDKTAFAAEAYSSNYLWIAEGFIPDNNEATAERYLEQLINGGFVDAGNRSDRGRINTCSIPGRCSPALLTMAFEGEFVISLIMDQEVKLRENVKRFTAHGNLNNFAFLDHFDSFLYSLLHLTSGSHYLDPTYCEKICKMFKFLRVLDLGSLVPI